MILQTEYLRNNPNFVLYNDFLEKPKDGRLPIKAFEPWYCTIDHLRYRIGKDHPLKLEKQQEIETIFKKCCAEMCDACNVKYTPKESDFPEPTRNTPDFYIDHDKAKEFLNRNNENEMGILFYLIDHERTQQRILERFLKSDYPTLGDFMVEVNRLTKLDQLQREAVMDVCNKSMYDLLKEFNQNPALRFEHYTMKDHQVVGNFSSQSWSQLSITEKYTCLQIHLRRLSIDKFDLKVSEWKPTDPISSLIKEIQIHGPLVVCGELGCGAYKNPPLKLEEIKGRAIYYWEVTNPRNKEAFNSVVIIGAREIPQLGGFVYFLDPRDSTPTIYVVPYSEIGSHILDLDGVFRSISPVGYAVYA
jgi:hypothetical protein